MFRGSGGNFTDRKEGGVGGGDVYRVLTFTFFWLFARHLSSAVVTTKHARSPAVTEGLLANN